MTPTISFTRASLLHVIIMSQSHHIRGPWIKICPPLRLGFAAISNLARAMVPCDSLSPATPRMAGSGLTAGPRHFNPRRHWIRDTLPIAAKSRRASCPQHLIRHEGCGLNDNPQRTIAVPYQGRPPTSALTVHQLRYTRLIMLGGSVLRASIRTRPILSNLHSVGCMIANPEIN